MRLLFALCLWLLSSVVVGAESKPGEIPPPEGSVAAKYSIPVEVELAYSRRVIEEVYGDQIRKARLMPEKARLAEELLELAKTPANRFELYALIDQAKDLAIDAKNVTLVSRALDMLCKEFEVKDPDQLRKQWLEEMAGESDKNAQIVQWFDSLEEYAKKNPKELRKVADAYYNLAETLRGPFQQSAKDRAVKYYGAAMKSMSGLEKKKAEERLVELTSVREKSKRSKKDTDLDCLVGKWSIEAVGRNRKATWTFNENGTLNNSSGFTGRWCATEDGIVVNWSTGAVDRLRRPIDPRGTILDTQKTAVAYVLRK